MHFAEIKLTLAERNKIAELVAGGFKDTGHWYLDSEGHIRFDGQVPLEPGVYAFTLNGEVCYIGSAQRGLRRRFRKYENANNKGAVAVRIRGCIADALEKNADVRVFARVCRGCDRLLWNELPIDLIAGLEEGLIRSLDPGWNNRGLAALRMSTTNKSKLSC